MKLKFRPSIAALASTVAIGFSPAGASAHGVLQASSPASGATLDRAPAELHLHFNEALEPKFSSIKLSDAKGSEVAIEPAAVDAADPRALGAKLPSLVPGAYAVHWSVMTRDGHRTHGDYGFQVK
jgi:methionine-rich copper-binding protein CopC